MGWDTTVVMVCLGVLFAWLHGRDQGRKEVRVEPHEHEHEWQVCGATTYVRGMDGPRALPRTAVTYVCQCGLHKQTELLGEHTVDELRWRTPASQLVEELLNTTRSEPPHGEGE